MATMIPAESGSGAEDILRQILSAETWEQLSQPWETSSVDDLLGRRLMLTHAVRRPSTFGQGLGIFLVLHMVDIRTGEKVVKTTGSLAVVGQVCRAYAIGAMPLEVEWCRAERPTEAGYFPQHLKVHDYYPPADGATS